MKHMIGSSLLALMIAGGSSMAIAQNASPDSATQPPSASDTQPVPSGQPSGSDATMGTDSSPNAMRDSAAAGMENTYTIAEGKKWVGKQIHSSNGESIGELSDLVEGADGNVEAFHANIGGFLGLGETTVRVKPSDLKLVDEKVTLSMTSEEAKNLPRVEQ